MKNLPPIIRIFIEEYNENWISYFLWTSPELEWFLVEANSIEELKEETPWVIKMYIEAINEVEENKKKQYFKNLLSKKTLNISFNWEQQLALA